MMDGASGWAIDARTLGAWFVATRIPMTPSATRESVGTAFDGFQRHARSPPRDTAVVDARSKLCLFHGGEHIEVPTQIDDPDWNSSDPAYRVDKKPVRPV